MTAMQAAKRRAVTKAVAEAWAARALERAAFLEFDGAHSPAVANRCAAGETLAALISECGDPTLKTLAGAVLAALGFLATDEASNKRSE